MGGDIVPAFVDRLKTNYSPNGCDLIQLDIVSDKLPKADVWLCRDVFLHLSEAEALAAIENLVMSGRTIYTTTNYDFVKTNKDDEHGVFRFINLRETPYRFGPPLKKIVEYKIPEPPIILG